MWRGGGAWCRGRRGGGAAAHANGGGCVRRHSARAPGHGATGEAAARVAAAPVKGGRQLLHRGAFGAAETPRLAPQRLQLRPQPRHLAGLRGRLAAPAAPAPPPARPPAARGGAVALLPAAPGRAPPAPGPRRRPLLPRLGLLCFPPPAR